MSQSKIYRRTLRSRIFPAILRRLKSIGLEIIPFINVREGVVDVPAISSGENFRFEFLSEDDIELLVDMGPNGGVERMRQWMQDGKLCFGAWQGQRLAAKMWCDLKVCNHKPSYRLLDDDEVYLFAAFSHPDFRGQNLAPLTRVKCYESLRELGRTKFYSFTDYFNLPARRFKKKLGAVDEAVMLYVSLFQRWSRTFTLKTYR